MATRGGGRVRTRLGDILTSGEEIEHVAEQKRLLVAPLFPRALVVTNRRLLLYRPRLFGRMAVEPFPWRDVRDARLDEGVLGATFRFRTGEGRTVEVSLLPQVPARRLTAIAQEREEAAREEERLRDLESKRAAAGGFAGPAASDPADPFERLRTLDGMLAARLISAGEYRTRREEILSRI